MVNSMNAYTRMQNLIDQDAVSVYAVLPSVKKEKNMLILYFGLNISIGKIKFDNIYILSTRIFSFKNT